MAVATTTKLIQLRPTYLSYGAGFIPIQFFSSSSSTPDSNEDTPQTNSAHPPPPPPKSPLSFSSLFGDVKATLKKPQGHSQSQPTRSPYSFLSSSPSSDAPRSSLKTSFREEIEKNLSEFRSRTAVPPPSSDSSAPQPPQQLSLEELYQRNVKSSGEESSSAGSRTGGSISIKAVSESLKQLRATTLRTQNQRFGKNNGSISYSNLRESLNLKPGDQSGRDSTRVIGGSDMPMAVFGKEMRNKDSDRANAGMSEDFLRKYNHKDLGEKLKSLRPEKKGDWFSLQELNERLMTLREIDREDKLFDLWSVISTLDKDPKQQAPTVDILGQLGRTPSFMLSPPQEHLMEKYFHPDNMSASEKLKLSLKKVRDEFKMSESDCGSARVQVAQLTTKIKHLSKVLHKKDKHSRKGLQGMVQKRKTLLKYLRRTDWESYCFVLSKLGLRDNPDYKN